MIELKEVFDIEYGNQLDYNKMVPDQCGINFITRSRRNLGIIGKVAPIKGQKIYPAGDITVTLGGTYLLSAHVQPAGFYTGQNIKVLRPKEEMSFGEKVFYCGCIELNRFRYSSHGREANRSLDTILVPPRAAVPDWAIRGDMSGISIPAVPLAPLPGNFSDTQELVPLSALFESRRGINVAKLPRVPHRESSNFVPIIRPSSTQISSYVEYVSRSDVPEELIFPKNSLYVSTNGQGSHTYAYVAPMDFVPNSDVTVLVDRSGDLSLAEKIYYASAITLNRPLFSYGRKPKGIRLDSLLVPRCAPRFVFGRSGTLAEAK